MTDDFPITTFHNPACGTSRNTLATIQAAGYAPAIVEYLKVGWTRPRLRELLTAMNAEPRDILREKGTPARDMGLLDASVTDDAIIDAMIAHPILVNRPIVITPKGAKSPFGKSVRRDSGAWWVVIQALDVDRADPWPDGRDRQEDQALSVGFDG